MKNVRKIAMEILSRSGKGPWMIWFPKKTQVYISKPIKTRTDQQALGSWVAAETEGRSWHNTVFQDHKRVVYRGRIYTKEQGKLLYRILVENDDWDSIDVGSPEATPEIDDSLKVVDTNRWVTPSTSR